MTREEKIDRSNWFSRTTTIYAYGIIGTVLLFCVLMNPLILVLGIGASFLLFISSNVIFSGAKLMSNPIRTLIETKEKQDALIDYLGLTAILIPRHWMFKKKNGKTRTSAGE